MPDKSSDAIDDGARSLGIFAAGRHFRSWILQLRLHYLHGGLPDRRLDGAENRGGKTPFTNRPRRFPERELRR